MSAIKFIRKRELDNKDHAFAGWLRDNGWNYDYKSVDVCTNEFYSYSGAAIARAVYDNSKCTFKVFINKSANG